MITAIILITFSVVAILFLFRFAKGHSVTVASSALSESIRSVDLKAFQNLVDPQEELFLRTRLSPADFRVVHRERMRAAIDYVSGAMHNAAVLVRMGEMARRNPDPSIAQAGERLVSDAIQLRLYSSQAIARLYVAILLPQVQVGVGRIPDSYQTVARQVALLSGLRFPTQGIASVL